MARIRHGVAGKPITHSLSPVLTALVHAHLSRKEGVKLPGLKGVVVIPTEGVENALAWGYAGALPSPPDWEYVNSPLGKFRANALLDRAVNASMEYVDADSRLPNTGLPRVKSKHADISGLHLVGQAVGPKSRKEAAPSLLYLWYELD